MEFSAAKSSRATDALETNRATPVKCLRETGTCSSKKVTWLIEQLKCFFSAHVMGNKKRELEAIVLLQSCDQNSITETQWDESHDWSTGVNGYKLFRRNRQRRKREDVSPLDKRLSWIQRPIFGKWWWMDWGLMGKFRDKPAKETSKLVFTMRLCAQQEHSDEAFLIQLEEASHTQAAVLLGTFNHNDRCWKSDTARCK